MMKIADILFIIGAALIGIYSIINIINPEIIKNRKKPIRLLSLIIPIFLFTISFLFYYLEKNLINKNPTVIGIDKTLDTLNKINVIDSASFNENDTTLQRLQRKSEEYIKTQKDQEELRKRIYIDFNKRLSDSISMQINSLLQRITAKKNYTSKTNFVKSGGKVIKYGNKIVVIEEKIFDDIYGIDGLEVFPIMKDIDFTPSSTPRTLNYYIDSIEVHFSVMRNKGKARYNEPDSLLFLTINPKKINYKGYKKLNNIKKEPISYLDSIYFKENHIYKAVLDFPNTSPQDTSVTLDFYLRRGLIGSYNIPLINFKKNE